MRTRPVALSLLLWALIPLTTTTSARAEGYLKAVETAVGIAKNMWDLGASLMPSAGDYGIYTAQFYPERYRDLIETYDHGSLTSKKRNNWRDPIDGSSKYLTETWSTSGTQVSDMAFLHDWGNCTWTCSSSANPKQFEINGSRTSIQISTYRVKTILIKAPDSAKNLVDPIPVTVLWNVEFPAPTGCGRTQKVQTVLVNTVASLSPSSGVLLNFPTAGAFNVDGPRTFIMARTDPK